MKILIIAQNLFVARILVSLAQYHPMVKEYRVIVFSSIEKHILANIHSVPHGQVIGPMPIDNVLLPNAFVDCIEIKRKAYSEHTISKLQGRLLAMLDFTSNFDYQNIWIFNQHTFIASYLRANQKYSDACVVFENSNKNGGVTILGDLNLENGKHLRFKFLNPKHFKERVPKFSSLRMYRVLTLVFHLRSFSGLRYYLKRMLTRFCNIMIFTLIRSVSKKNMRGTVSEPGILVALQIEHDSSILMKTDFNTYTEQLIAKTLEISSNDPKMSIFVRPHPRDYTFGWLKFFLKIRRSMPNAVLDLSNIDNAYDLDIRYLITFSSNLVRNSIFRHNDVQVHIVDDVPPLPCFDANIFQIYDNSM